MTNIPVGITIGVVSSAAQSLGLILQRMAHLQPDVRTHSNPLWHIGLVLFLSSNLIGSTIQLTTLPILVLTPLQSIGLLFNSIFHTVLLKEPFTRTCLVGSVYITLGSMGIAFTGNSLPDVDYSLDQFILLLNGRPFACWILVNIVLITAAVLASIFISHDRLMSAVINSIDDWNTSLRLRSYSPRWTRTVGVLITASNSMSRYLTLMAMNSTLITGICIACISGVLSSYSILLAKSAIEIIITHLFDLKSINSFQMYLIVLVFLTLGGGQLILLNYSLKLLSTSILYPLVFSIFNIFSILNYLIFYNQFNCLTWVTLSLLVLGTVSVIVGVYILSLQNNPNNRIHNHLLDANGDCMSTSSTTPLMKRCSITSINHSLNADLSGYISFNSLNLDEDAAANHEGDFTAASAGGTTAGGNEINYTNLLDDL